MLDEADCRLWCDAIDHRPFSDRLHRCLQSTANTIVIHRRWYHVARYGSSCFTSNGSLLSVRCVAKQNKQTRKQTNKAALCTNTNHLMWSKSTACRVTNPEHPASPVYHASRISSSPSSWTKIDSPCGVFRHLTKHLPRRCDIA